MDTRYYALAEDFKRVLCMDLKSRNNFVMALISVREQGFLRISEVRQFSNMGIPLIATLAERFNVDTSTIHKILVLGDVITYSDVIFALYDILNRFMATSK